MVTDKQYMDLLAKFNDLEKRYALMSQEIAAIKMKLDIRGVQRTNTEPQSKKDVTKYIFAGQQLNKRQLVLECIKKYMVFIFPKPEK